jgi:threonine/homoserine/homoserine lactone efflux protein
VPTIRRNPDAAALRRDRRRGLVLAVVAFVGLVAEAISLVQDGLSAPKIVALVCFAFLFWWGWELRRVPESDSRAGPTGQ